MRHRRRPPVSRVDHIDRPMSAGEVAAYLGISRAEVYRCVREGRIRAKKTAQLLYFDPREILVFDGRLGDAPDATSSGQGPCPTPHSVAGDTRKP